MNRFLTLLVSLTVVLIVYSRLSTPVREKVSGLFALDYEIPVAVVQVARQSMGEVVAARGELEPLRETKVTASLPGVVKEIPYASGDKVATGAVVAVIESNDLTARLEAQSAAVKEAEANVKESREELAAAEKQLAIVRQWYEKNLIARREVDLAEAALKTARAERDATEAQLAQRVALVAQTRHVLALSRVTAPAAGIVTRRWVEPTATVSAAAPILSLAHTETMKLWTRLKSADAEKIAPSSPAQVKVDALPSKVFRGRVTQVQDLANFFGDESSVEVELPNPGSVLRPGMSATVTFAASDLLEGLFVPQEALTGSDGESYLYVAEGGMAWRRRVATGREYKGNVEILSGIQTGETVVVSGNERLRDGSRVRPVE